MDTLPGAAVVDRPFAGAVENISEHLPFDAAMSVLKIRSVAAQLAGCLQTYSWVGRYACLLACCFCMLHGCYACFLARQACLLIA